MWSYFKVDDEPDKEVIQQQTTNNYHPQFDIIKRSFNDTSAKH